MVSRVRITSAWRCNGRGVDASLATSLVSTPGCSHLLQEYSRSSLCQWMSREVSVQIREYINAVSGENRMSASTAPGVSGACTPYRPGCTWRASWTAQYIPAAGGIVAAVDARSWSLRIATGPGARAPGKPGRSVGGHRIIPGAPMRICSADRADSSGIHRCSIPRPGLRAALAGQHYRGCARRPDHSGLRQECTGPAQCLLRARPTVRSGLDGEVMIGDRTVRRNARGCGWRSRPGTA